MHNLVVTPVQACVDVSGFMLQALSVLGQLRLVLHNSASLTLVMTPTKFMVNMYYPQMGIFK